MEHSQDRRYSLSMAYPSENAVVDDVYSQYNNSALSATNDQMSGYTQYTTQDQYATTTHGYNYPPPQSPPADQPSGSPHSPPNRPGQRLASATTLPPLPSSNNRNSVSANRLGRLHFMDPYTSPCTVFGSFLTLGAVTVVRMGLATTSRPSIS